MSVNCDVFGVFIFCCCFEFFFCFVFNLYSVQLSLVHLESNDKHSNYPAVMTSKKNICNKMCILHTYIHIHMNECNAKLV